MGGEQLLEMLTKPASTKDFDFTKYKEQLLAGTVKVSADVFNDYMWGKRFGRREKSGMVWKYGNPWLYPAHEFNQLKTIVLAEDLAEEERIYNQRKAMPDVVAALGISDQQKEQNKKLSGSMAKFFKELPA